MSQREGGPYPGGPVIAIDGPSGSGKSSAAKGVARTLGLRYLDTGAMYRALTWWMLRAHVDLSDPEAIAAGMGATEADGPTLTVSTDPDGGTVIIDGADVSTQIRGREVSNAVSAVSAVACVRERMVAHQRRLIGAGGIVVEGRDIGSTVAPDAPVKVYLTASADERARRRNAELAATTVAGAPQSGHVGRDAVGGADRGPKADRSAKAGRAGSEPSDADAAAEVERTQAEMARRDRLDAGRLASPLTRADGATELDTTGLSLSEVVEAICALANEMTGPSAR